MQRKMKENMEKPILYSMKVNLTIICKSTQKKKKKRKNKITRDIVVLSLCAFKLFGTIASRFAYNSHFV